MSNYEFVVGWLNEPALVYQPNGLSLRITLFPNGVPAEESEEAEAEGQPVEGLEETMQAEIIAGGGAETMSLTLEPAFGDPGPLRVHHHPHCDGRLHLPCLRRPRRPGD